MGLDLMQVRSSRGDIRTLPLGEREILERPGYRNCRTSGAELIRTISRVARRSDGVTPTRRLGQVIFPLRRLGMIYLIIRMRSPVDILHTLLLLVFRILAWPYTSGCIECSPGFDVRHFLWATSPINSQVKSHDKASTRGG